MTDTASTRLAACPCGALPAHGYMCGYDDEEGYGYVECHEGGLSVVVHAATEAEAIAAWNERSTPPSQDKGEALTDDVERVALAAADAAIDAIRVGFPGWRPSDAQLGFGRAVGKRAYLAALSTAQASEREQIVAWLRSDDEDCGFDGYNLRCALADAIERGDYLATPVEPSPVDVERVARIADELATRWGEQWKAKYKGKPRDSYENGRLAGLSDGAAIVAREIRAALQSPPVEQPAQAEARAALSTKEEGLVEELATLDVFLAAYTHHPDGEVLASAIDPTDDLLTLGQLRRILAALKTRTSKPGEPLGLLDDGMCDDHGVFGCKKCLASLAASRTSPETVELLREAREQLNDVSAVVDETTWRAVLGDLVDRIDAHLSNTPGKESSDG